MGDDGVDRASALVDAIYHSALDPTDWLVLRDRMMQSCREAPTYSPQQQRFVEYILGHVQRALKIADQHERIAAERLQLEKLVDTVAPAVWVVRADGAPVGANPAALAMLPQEVAQSPLQSPLQHAGLSRASRDALGRLLTVAAADGYASASLPSTNADDVLQVHVGKLASCQQPLFSLVVFPQLRQLKTAVRQFANQYHLTAKESSVLLEALRNARLQDAAVAEGIAYHTARQHLKSVYDKTGAGSQAELLAGLMQHIVVGEAARTQNRHLLAHQYSSASSTTLNVGSRRQPRRLCYAEFGDPDGSPVLYFHTITGSRLELGLHDQRLRTGRIRLIAVDRPGYGGSDHVEYEGYGSFTQDLHALLDQLCLRRVGLLACSAGTPHALSAAARLPERVSLVQCVGGIPPMEHVIAASSNALRKMAQTQLFRVAPRLMQPALELLLRRQTVQSMYQAMLGGPSRLFRYDARDVEYISHPDRLGAFVACSIEAMRQGTKAWAREGTVANLPWNIPFDRTQCPVHFWHGRADFLFPVETIESFASEFPNQKTTVVEGETHLLLHRHLASILPAFHDNT